MPNKGRLLELALKGLEAERARIDDEITQLRRQLGTGTNLGRRRTMSAAAKRKISEAMKRRHGALRSGRQPEAGPRRGGLTAVGRKKLSDMMKARWAAKRKSGKKAA